jgi:hypothetical protein
MKAVNEAVAYLRSVCEPFGDVIDHCTKLKAKHHATSSVALAAVQASIGGQSVAVAAVRVPAPFPAPIIHVATLVDALYVTEISNEITETIVDAVESRLIRNVT